MNFKSLSFADQVVDQNTTLFWLRRDLRLTDNRGLFHALTERKDVLPLFIFDDHILDRLEDKADRRVEFILNALAHVRSQLHATGSSLLILRGKPEAIFKQLNAGAVYTNHDYEPYARDRDKKVGEILEGRGIAFKTFKDQVIFEKSEIVKDDGKPYTVFTPYSKKWKAALKASDYKPFPTERHLGQLKKVKPLPFPKVEDIGFKATSAAFPERVIKGKVIDDYKQQRDFPATAGTTKLSVHLRFGTVSIRNLVDIGRKRSEVWLNELIWREFYHMILWHFPRVDEAFKPVYDQIKWRNNEKEFQAWCQGQTGYPIVDAGMRELNETGFMHNRVRMIVASFLTKHLLIDWRWGEAYFAKKLLDFDLAANNGGWQWAAGSGCDAAPYFRVFNPYLQTEKFDPDRDYIRQWVPEYESKNYPTPIVKHDLARKRALEVYKAALEKG